MKVQKAIQLEMMVIYSFRLINFCLKNYLGFIILCIGESNFILFPIIFLIGSSLGPMLPGSKRHNDLRRQIETLKEELLQTEAQRDDFKASTMQLQEELVVMRLKLDESSVSVSDVVVVKLKECF